VIPAERVEEIASRIDGVLVVDEAYVDFTEGDCVGLIHHYDNIIVLRTLSKSFSLAGMRVGMAMASERLIQGMIKVKDSYNLNRLSMAAGEAALEDIHHMHSNAEKIRTTRVLLTEGLTALGFHVYPSHSNFVLARIARPRASHLYQELKYRKILVRYFNQRRLENCLRITVGTDGEIDQLLAELKDLCGSLT
jgi:histidinol-phosphate aminotransferase